MNDDKVEVFELTQEQWDAAIAKRMKALNVTKAQLIEKHRDGRLSAEEFKLWMLIRPSTL